MARLSSAQAFRAIACKRVVMSHGMRRVNRYLAMGFFKLDRS